MLFAHEHVQHHPLKVGCNKSRKQNGAMKMCVHISVFMLFQYGRGACGSNAPNMAQNIGHGVREAIRCDPQSDSPTHPWVCHCASSVLLDAALYLLVYNFPYLSFPLESHQPWGGEAFPQGSLTLVASTILPTLELSRGRWG